MTLHEIVIKLLSDRVMIGLSPLTPQGGCLNGKLHAQAEQVNYLSSIIIMQV